MVTEAERERLVILMEECGEVVQACSKILRWGKDSIKSGESNLDRLRMELDDVQGMIWAMEQFGDISGDGLQPWAVWERKKRWMKFQD